jgi:hypothetical protein
MLSAQSLREQMSQYAAGVLSSESLEEWLASESWDIKRWAPRGLQQLVEALQVAFIAHADGHMSAQDLDTLLRLRHDQLQRAAEVTAEIQKAWAAWLRTVERERSKPESIAASQAVALTLAAA